MPGQRTPAAAPLGGSISRRHAELLLHSGVGGGSGVCVKDLRIRRVVPPASAPLDSSTSPDCAAAAKPGPVESTPPEAVAAAAAAEDLERKPVTALPRSKLVRNPGSFGYRRLLPFLNQMAKNDGTICNGMPAENTAANSAKDLKRSRIWLVDESAGGGHREPDPVESAELVTVKTGGEPETKDGCDDAGEETNTVPHDIAGNKPWFTRCTRSRLVHHLNSFSYKRMLPFLMENEISSQEGERVKIRRIAEERQLTPDGNDISASVKHNLDASEESSQECKSAQTEIMEEEKPSNADGNHVLEVPQLQSAVPKASAPECSADEMQNAIQQESSTLSQDSLISYEDASTSDGNDAMAGGQHQLPVSEDCPEECSRDEVKTRVQDKSLKSDDDRKLQPGVPEASLLEDSTTEGQKATEEQPLTSDAGKGNTSSDKGEFLAKEQPQLCDTKELLTAQVEYTAEFPEATQCQSSDSRCPDVGIGSPSKTVLPLVDRNCSQECQDAVSSLDDLHLEAVMIHKPSDHCAVDRYLSVEEMSGCVPSTETQFRKTGMLQSPDALSLGKRGLSPKKLSPRKGILKRHTRGCKGICMCLDCCTFRLRADRAFEFSRKQMQEADDIIGNLLKEVATLRSLVEKPSGHRESIQAACQRASRAEEVARERCQQMFVDLNLHCRIPGPRVRFAQYVEENLGTSPSRKYMEEKLGSSPRSSSSSSKRRCLKS